MRELTQRQHQIMTVSLELISSNGIQGFTIKKLSEKIGISEPAIYRHFKNKEEILKTILLSFFEKTKEKFSNLKENDNSFIDKIKEIINNHFKEFAKNKTLSSVMFSEELFSNNKNLFKIVEDIMIFNQKELTKLILLGQKDGNIKKQISAKHLTIIIMGSLRLFVKNWYHAKFSYDLFKEGKLFWKSLESIL